MTQKIISIDYRVTQKGKDAPLYLIDSDFDDGQKTFENLLIFTKQSLIRISDEVLREEQARGFDKKPTLLVDGKFNKKKEDVNPLGKIQYIARTQTTTILKETFDAINQRTIIGKTQNYKRNNAIYYNSTYVASTWQEFEAWLKLNNGKFKAKDIIRFINVAPYARKLERLGYSKDYRGKDRLVKTRAPKKHEKRKSTLRILVPNGTYALAFKAIKRKYKANSFLKFELLRGEYIKFNGNVDDYKYKRGKTPGRFYLFPSIVISLIEAGLTDVSSAPTNRTPQ